MDTIKFYDIPKLVTMGKLTFDGQKDDLRLHCDDSFSWGAKNKTAYNKAAKAIDKIQYSGNGWKIYAWYDISGYDYWMKNMKETNYIQITVAFDTEDIDKDEIGAIDKALDSAIADADALQKEYSYDPSYSPEYD